MAIPRISVLLMLLASAGSLGCGEKLYVLDTGETGTHEDSDTDGSTGDPQPGDETGSGDATGDDGSMPDGETSGDGGTPGGDTGTTGGEGDPGSGGDTTGDPGGESSGDPGGDTSGDPNPGEGLVEQLESSAAKIP